MAKQKIKITNWPAYNKALRQRGSLTVWLDESAIAAWTELKKRRPTSVAVVAMANKLARTVWAIAAHEYKYDKNHVSIKPC